MRDAISRRPPRRAESSLAPAYARSTSDYLSTKSVSSVSELSSAPTLSSASEGSPSPPARYRAPATATATLPQTKSGPAATAAKLGGRQLASAAVAARDDNAPPCAFWLSGYCRRGADCTFRHDSPFAIHLPTLPDPRNETCRNFLRGVCHLGDRCKYRHPKSEVVAEPPSVSDTVVVLPPEVEPPPRPQNNAVPKRPMETLDRLVRDSILVHFGPGLDLIRVSLAGDNVPVNLSGLPQNVRRKELVQIVNDLAPALSVIIHKRSKQPPTATATYGTREIAQRAVKAFNGVAIDGAIMSADLNLPLHELD